MTTAGDGRRARDRRRGDDAGSCWHAGPGAKNALPLLAALSRPYFFFCSAPPPPPPPFRRGPSLRSPPPGSVHLQERAVRRAVHHGRSPPPTTTHSSASIDAEAVAEVELLPWPRRRPSLLRSLLAPLLRRAHHRARGAAFCGGERAGPRDPAGKQHMEKQGWLGFAVVWMEEIASAQDKRKIHCTKPSETEPNRQGMDASVIQQISMFSRLPFSPSRHHAITPSRPPSAALPSRGTGRRTGPAVHIFCLTRHQGRAIRST